MFSKSATSININLRKGQGKAFAFKTKFLSVSLSDIDCPQHVFRQQKLVREAFGLSPKERLLLDERLYAKRWKSSKEKMKEEGLEREEGEEEEEEGQVPDLDDQDWMSACCSEEAVSFFSALATTVGSTGVEVEKLCSETAPPLPTSLPVSLPVSQPLSPSCSLPPAADIVYSAPPPLQSQPYQQVKFQYFFVKLESIIISHVWMIIQVKDSSLTPRFRSTPPNRSPSLNIGSSLTLTSSSRTSHR